MTGKRKYFNTPYVFAITKRRVILSAWRERIRISLKRKTDYRAPYSLLRYPKVVFAIAKRCVILSAWRERIRIPLKRKTDYRAPCGAFITTFQFYFGRLKAARIFLMQSSALRRFVGVFNISFVNRLY